MNLDHLNLQVQDPVACRDFYQTHFGFRPAFEADGGYFVRNEHGFLLALVPSDPHLPLPPGVHIGFRLDTAAEVFGLHRGLDAAGVVVGELEDERPRNDYVTFRTWDPDGTEIELFWEPGALGA